MLLELSSAAYAEIAKALRDAGYDHAFHDHDDRGVVIDMHGIAVCQGSEPERAT